MPYFQTQVNAQQSPATEGDFASINPRATVLAGPGGLVAAKEGVFIGRFAWLDWRGIDADNAPAVVTSAGTGPVAGFIHRNQQGIITQYLAGASMRVNGGLPITVHSRGDFWVQNRTGAYAYVGQKAFARLSDGAVLFGAVGASPGAATFTGSIAASAFTGTVAISDNVATISGLAGQTVVIGATIAGTGIVAGTKIVQQLTGGTGGNGTYAVSIPSQNVAATALTGSYGTLTVTAVAGGTISTGCTVTGSGVVAGTYITAPITGAGGVGTYVVSNNTVVASTAMTAATAVETDWFCATSGAANELVKITSWPTGNGGLTGPGDPSVPL